ncbi:MAG TPA: AI-2E family transporter [Phycisphaerae bacterium]|nr:AI-2E family transporter [Phycisphaerae bacterium]
MAEEESPETLGTDKGLAAPTVTAHGGETSEAIARAPAAVKRSMPMALSIMLGILLAALVGWFFYHLTWFILLLYLSFIAATILEAPVQWLKKAGIRRSLASVIVMVGGLAIVGGVVWFVGYGVYNQVSAVSSNLQRAPERIDKTINDILHHLPGYAKTHRGTTTAAAGAATASAATEGAATTAPASAPATEEGEFDVASSIRSMVPGAGALVQHAMMGVEGLSWLVIMFFLVLYMLVDGADHLKTLRCLLPKEGRLEATRLFTHMSQAHRGWAVASLSNVCSSTLLSGTGLWLLGIPGAYVLGFFAGLGELIPNIGPIIGATPAILLTLVAEPEKFFYVMGMFVIVWTIQGYTISPWMMKFGVELPVLVTIVSVLVFGMLFGFLGVLVAIPLVADMVVVWDFMSARREKDTTNYDIVNAPPADRRQPMSPDNTSPGRLRKMFRRSRQAAAVSSSPPPPSGLAGLAEAEKKSGT